MATDLDMRLDGHTPGSCPSCGHDPVGMKQRLDDLIIAARNHWGVGSEQHNLIRDVVDAIMKRIEPCEKLRPLRDVSAMSADPGNNRILCLHFNREISGEDREAILAAINAAPINTKAPSRA